MFSKAQLVTIGKALVGMEKSVNRLAAKEEQPDSVATEYRKVAAELASLIKDVNVEITKLDQAADLAAKAKK